MTAQQAISESLYEHITTDVSREQSYRDAATLIDDLKAWGYVVVQASHVDPLYSPIQVPEHYRLAVSDPAHPGHTDAEREEADVQF